MNFQAAQVVTNAELWRHVIDLEDIGQNCRFQKTCLIAGFWSMLRANWGFHLMHNLFVATAYLFG